MAARKKPRRKKPARVKRVKAGRRTRRSAEPAKPERARGGRGAKRTKPRPRRAQRPAARLEPRATRARPEPANDAAPTSQPGAAPPGAASRTYAGALAVLASTPIRVGTVRHFYPESRAARISVDGAFESGERLHVRGATSDFLMQVDGLRVDGRAVERVAGGEATVAVPSRVRPGDALYALRPRA